MNIVCTAGGGLPLPLAGLLFNGQRRSPPLHTHQCRPLQRYGHLLGSFLTIKARLWIRISMDPHSFYFLNLDPDPRGNQGNIEKITTTKNARKLIFKLLIMRSPVLKIFLKIWTNSMDFLFLSNLLCYFQLFIR